MYVLLCYSVQRAQWGRRGQSSAYQEFFSPRVLAVMESILVCILCLPLPSLHLFDFYEIFLLLVIINFVVESKIIYKSTYYFPDYKYEN